MAHVMQYVESKKSSSPQAASGPQVTVKLINESPAFQGIMYMGTWNLSQNKVVGSGATLTAPFNGTQVRFTFAARLGAYSTSADSGYYVAFAVKSPGTYEVSLHVFLVQRAHVLRKEMADFLLFPRSG